MWYISYIGPQWCWEQVAPSFSAWGDFKKSQESKFATTMYYIVTLGQWYIFLFFHLYIRIFSKYLSILFNRTTLVARTAALSSSPRRTLKKAGNLMLAAIHIDFSALITSNQSLIYLQGKIRCWIFIRSHNWIETRQLQIFL